MVATEPIVDAAFREAWVRRAGGGDLIACATLQEGLSCFETSFGFWAYRRVWGMDVTLGGPLCAAADRGEMIRRFLSRSRRPILCYIRDDLVRALEGTRLHCVGMGVDRHVDITALLRRPAPEVRGALKKARKAGLSLTPVNLATLPASLRARLDAISARYLAHAECCLEISFLNRPMSLFPDPMRRVFLLEKHDREHDGVFGFAVLNPVFDDGVVTRYLLDILRFEPTRLWGVWPTTVYLLAERLAAEGVGLTLGFCPLHHVTTPPAAASAWLGAQVRWLVRYLSSAQYLTRLREMKALIPGPEEPRFIASFSRSALVTLFAFMEASGIGFHVLFGPDLLRVMAAGLRATPTQPAQPARGAA
jgi:lysylphosphatidylglycerol synthetase-like protein (DUF2156 family)